MDRFLNHTHPPLWATSFLREVNLGTACGCEVFLLDLDSPIKSGNDIANLFLLWIATPDYIRFAMTFR